MDACARGYGMVERADYRRRGRGREKTDQRGVGWDDFKAELARAKQRAT